MSGQRQVLPALLQEIPGKLVISVSNPENEELTVAVEVSRKLRGENVEHLADKMASRVTFHLPDGLYAGKSVTRMLHVLP